MPSALPGKLPWSFAGYLFRSILTRRDLQKNKSLAAVKMVQRSKLSRKLLENLESEIQILKKLNHPHIVALNDCKKSDKFIHLIMEYCSVGDLSILIKKRDRMASVHPCLEPVARDYPSPPGGGLHEVLVRHFAKQLASALEFLRKDGLVHRDVKPQNLLLNPSPDYVAQYGEESDMEGSRMLVGLRSLPVLKLADFGFARVLPSTAMAETLCGSPLYMAPEILRYEKYDATADLWSVGTVLYEMMAGRPPFRAPNHVDLLRKIEAKNDKIDFPQSCVSSDEPRGLVRALLKRNPLERMSFEEFFSHPVILAEAHEPLATTPEKPRAEPIAQVEAQEIRSSSSYRRTVADQRALGVEREERHLRDGLPSSPRPSRPVSTIEDSALPFATYTPSPTSATHLAAERPAELRRYTTQSGRPQSPLLTRPGIVAHATAPARDDLIVQRRSAAMERIHSRESNPSPGTSLMMQHREAEQQQREPSRRMTHKRGNSSRELRNSDEDYVIVDKHQVQVNAFADELATARRGGVTPPSANALVRRLSSGGTQRSPARQAPARSGEYVHPMGSYERKYGSSPGTAAKSALAKALEIANMRIFGVGLSPQNHSPPNIASPFPPYPGPGSLVVVGNGGNLMEEDAVALHTIEDSASRSDVVYNFAEVKYAQLMPSARPQPQPQGLGLLATGGVQLEPSEGQNSPELTPGATILAAEECMVLFVKVLSLLSKATDVAHVWWAATGQHGKPVPTARTTASIRMNSVVQWMRERYNEVLEKAQIVQEKIIEAQKDLPLGHPSHPSNYNSVTHGTTDSNFMLTTGVTAEKLMYDRALEMSRAAAVNELVGEDLSGCEGAYVTSLRLLEAMLEKRDDDEMNLDDDDKKLIDKCTLPLHPPLSEITETDPLGIVLVNIRQRLNAIRKKMDGLARRSPIHSAHGSPHLRHLSPSPGPTSSSSVPGHR